MAQILELLTVNIAVASLDHSIPKYKAFGLEHEKPDHMPEPPAQITDVSFPLRHGGAFSLIEPTDPTSPVAKFIERRGQGPYSIAVRTDDIVGLKKQWTHVEWVLEKPVALDNAMCVGRKVERLLMNWVKPSSLDGVMLEIFEFQGKVSDD